MRCCLNSLSGSGNDPIYFPRGSFPLLCKTTDSHERGQLHLQTSPLSDLSFSRDRINQSSAELSIVASFSSADDEDDDRAEYADSDSEGCYCHNNACRDDAFTGIGKGNAVVAVLEGDRIRAFTGNCCAAVKAVGRGIVIGVLCNGADCACVETDDLNGAAVCERILTGSCSVGADSDRGGVTRR